MASLVPTVGGMGTGTGAAAAAGSGATAGGLTGPQGAMIGAGIGLEHICYREGNGTIKAI